MKGYRCLACNAEQSVDFGGFVCPACGGNLDITYDYAAVEPGFGLGEGMFRYQSLLPCADPGISLPLTIGGTPLHRVRRLGASAGLENLWLKDETGNPSSSIKDRASAVALLRAVATREWPETSSRSSRHDDCVCFVGIGHQPNAVSAAHEEEP